MSEDPLLTALQKACKGLLFISETEAGLEPFVWADGGPLAEAEKGATVETMELAEFFRAVPKENKAKFDALTKVLNGNMTGIKVHKIGEVNLKVFIVGKTKDGRWAGVKTEVVET